MPSSSAADRELEIRIALRQASEREKQEMDQEGRVVAKLEKYENPPVYYIRNAVPPPERIASPEWTAAYHYYVSVGYEYDVAQQIADVKVGGRIVDLSETRKP